MKEWGEDGWRWMKTRRVVVQSTGIIVPWWRSKLWSIPRDFISFAAKLNHNLHYYY